MTGHRPWNEVLADVQARRAAAAARPWAARALTAAGSHLRRTRERVASTPSTIKSTVQRARRGWSDDEVGELSWRLAVIIAGSVTQLRDTTPSYSGDSPEQWHDILTRIADGFTAHQRLDELLPSDFDSREEYERVAGDLQEQKKEGMELFVTWFDALWK